MTEEIRDAVYNAVVACVQRVGHEQVDIRMIAREAGCSTGAVYTVAPTKGELLEMVRSDLIESFEDHLNSLVPLPTVWDYFGVLADAWGRDQNLALFTSSFVNIERTGTMPVHWLETAATAGFVPRYEDRSEAYWKEHVDITAAVIGNLGSLEPRLIESLIRRHGPQLQEWTAAALDSEPLPMAPEVLGWVAENPVEISFDDPMLEALFEMSMVDEQEEIAASGLAARAGCSVASVYRAGGIDFLTIRMVDLVTVLLAARLDELPTVVDRCTAMTARQIEVVTSYPRLLNRWGRVHGTDILGPLRQTSFFHEWLRYQVGLARATGELRTDVHSSSDLIVSFFVGPIQMWAGRPGSEQRILDWAMTCVGLFAADR